MGTVRFDHAMGLTMRSSAALHRRVLTTDESTIVRTLALAALAAGLSLGLVTGGVLHDSGAALVAIEPVASHGKDRSRLDGSGERHPANAAAALLTPEADTTGGRGSAATSPASETTIDGPKQEPSEWRDEDFAAVQVIDGRTLSAGAVTIRLDGLELPPADQVCRTLDNRLEPCVARAATQLELLTRARTLACRYRMTTSSEAIGSCRIGAHDLADRMIRTGYVRAAEAGKAVTQTGNVEAASR